MESGQRKNRPKSFSDRTGLQYHKYYKISCEIHKILKLESVENLGILFRCDYSEFCMKQNPDNDWKRQNNN